MPAVLRVLLLTALVLAPAAADAQAATLVGAWEMIEPIEATASVPVLTIRADGTLEVRLTAPGYAGETPATGRYTVTGDTIISTLSGEAESARYAFDNGDLVLDDRGYVMRFRRTSGC